MLREWETVLGQPVLFLQLPDGRWRWQAGELDVQADPNVSFPSVSAARLACAAMIHAFYVMEEVTSDPVPTPAPSSDPSAGERGPNGSPPTHGSVGGN